MGSERELEELGVNVVRGLAMDGPERAGNGHPGTAMALAPLGHVLFTRVMRHDPAAPDWPDRDRFVLSPGHASILLYSFLYLTGYGLELSDLEAFRQLGSRTPGHPERLHTAGVEVTTGPLGQGIGNAVGMAIAEESLRGRFGTEAIDHRTFAIVSDGDLQEGISHEAASLAGHLGLGRLVCVWDDNRITIDGPTSLSWSDDVAGRFRSYGWHVDEVGELGDDLDAIEEAIRRGIGVEDKPTLICLRTHIGWPSSKQDTSEAHGTALGAQVVADAKKRLGLPSDQSFYVPEPVLDLYRRAVPRGEALRRSWEERLESYPGDKEELEAALAGRPLAGWEDALPRWEPGGKSVATRIAGAGVLDALQSNVPSLLVGGADLTGNTGVAIDAVPFTAENRKGRLIHYGIREHGMAAAMNGMAAHGGILPVGGTFFVFSDYCRPSIRLAAISQLPVIYSFSHDSVGLGNDGPTHQPIEHLAGLRAMPGLRVIRPADANETAHAYRLAITHRGPTAIVLSRQPVPVLEGTADAFDGVSNGAYVLREDEEAQLTLIGTGSEVWVCLAAADQLAGRGVNVRVVSMPSWDLFEDATPDWQQQVLPDHLPALAVEAASSFGWERWAEHSVTIDRFGASGDGDAVLEALGFTVDHVADEVEDLLEMLEDDDEDGGDDHDHGGRRR
jgi:transketolase